MGKSDCADGLAQFSHGIEGCTQRIPITTKTVLAPYLTHPRLLLDIWRWAAPVHFTVLYFHLDPADRYIIPSDGKSFHGGRILMKASQIRERIVTPYYWGIIAAGLLVPFVRYKAVVSFEIRTVTLLLALFTLSQIPTALLGEGVRDLSKHLAGAQICLDILCVFLIYQIVVYGYHAITRTSLRRGVTTSY